MPSKRASTAGPRQMRLRERLAQLDSRAWTALQGPHRPLSVATSSAALGVLYGTILLIVVVAGTLEQRADAHGVYALLTVVPWATFPLLAVLLGRHRLTMSFIGGISAGVQAAMLLPANGFGVVYLPMAALSATATVSCVFASVRSAHSGGGRDVA